MTLSKGLFFCDLFTTIGSPLLFGIVFVSSFGNDSRAPSKGFLAISGGVIGD